MNQQDENQEELLVAIDYNERKNQFQIQLYIVS